MINRDAGEAVEHWIELLRIDPENRYALALLEKAELVNNRKLGEWGGITFAYAAVFFTEGLGLYFYKRWAEWLTVVVTGSFVPLEIYELLRHPSVVKLVLLLGNVAIVGLLIWQLRAGRHAEPSGAPIRNKHPS